MSGTFVVLAAGRGTRLGRVGESLHKALVPLDGRAALSHLFKRAGLGSKFVVCVGYRAEQLRQYVELAHPGLPVTFVHVESWDQIGGGPGRSLLAARPHVVGDLTFTSCDTLWEPFNLEEQGWSWAAVAPVPAGTSPARWCRLVADDLGKVERVFDKTTDKPEGWAYTGLAHIVGRDLETFWNGIERCEFVGGELQVSGGFTALAEAGHLFKERIAWTDIGDESAYRLAVAKYSGYDWTKIGQATYVLPEEGRVVKFSADESMIEARMLRANLLGNRVPQPLYRRGSMLAYPFVPGRTGYQVVESEGVQFIDEVADWLAEFPRVSVPRSFAYDLAYEFYHNKTRDRAARIESPELRRLVFDAIERIDFKDLAFGCDPGVFHGDANLGNILRTHEGNIIGIDWREDFAGVIDFGDLRYDRAKLLAGTVVNWDAARRGDFRPWDDGAECRQRLLARPEFGRDVQIIGALSLLNSAPLHAAPLDEVLVAHGASWLEELL